MEIETVETFLINLGYDRYIDKFHENEVDVELLTDLSENDLKETLKELGLPVGVRMKIVQKIKTMKTKEPQTQKECSDDKVVGTNTNKEKTKDLCRADIDDVGNDKNTKGEEAETQRETQGECSDDDIVSAYTNEEKMKDLYKADIEVEDSGKMTKGKDKVKALIGNFEKWTRKLGLFSPQPSSGTYRKDSEKLLAIHSREKEIRLVLLGKTGSGKSATGNTILGGEKSLFRSFFSFTSVTRDCSQNLVERFGRKILVVDTPGIFDTTESNEKVQQEIYKCVGITSPGPHAFLLVLNISTRFTKEEELSVQHFVEYFGEYAYKYFIVLFTRKDELEKSDMTLKEHLENAPPKLQSFIKKCGDRVLAFNNNLKGEKQDRQVIELLSIVDKNVKENGEKFYTNEMYAKAEEELKKFEAEKLRREKEQRERERLERYAKENQQKLKEQEEQIKRLQILIDELNQKNTEENKKEYSELLETKNKKIETFMKEQEEAKRKLQAEVQQEIETRATTIRNETREAIEKKSRCSIS